MSYEDPTYIKKHAIKVSLDDHINEIINDIVAQTGKQRGVIARRLLLKGLEVYEQHKTECKEKPG